MQHYSIAILSSDRVIRCVQDKQDYWTLEAYERGWSEIKEESPPDDRRGRCRCQGSVQMVWECPSNRKFLRCICRVHL